MANWRTSHGHLYNIYTVIQSTVFRKNSAYSTVCQKSSSTSFHYFLLCTENVIFTVIVVNVSIFAHLLRILRKKNDWQNDIVDLANFANLENRSMKVHHGHLKIMIRNLSIFNRYFNRFWVLTEQMRSYFRLFT